MKNFETNVHNSRDLNRKTLRSISAHTFEQSASAVMLKTITDFAESWDDLLVQDSHMNFT